MGKQLAAALVIIFLLFFLPWLWGEPTVERETPPESTEKDTPPAPEPEEPEVGDDQTAGGDSIDGRTMLRVLIGGQLRQMDMATYLMGVVRAEMPASFAQEALKAQAVAARPSTIHKMENGGSPNHPEADACDDITCCKAYLGREEAGRSWGDKAAEYEEKIRRAVADTDGVCVLYQGRPVLAVFHSSSAGATLDAQDVWSGSQPYLQSVQSPETAETVPNYHSTASFTAGELQAKLQAALPEAELGGSPSNWFTNISQEPGGAVKRITVGGEELTGNQLRTILGLRSPCFTIAFDGDTVTFSVTGYGHGVGMSQYGANVLAADGMGYAEILTWYYAGTEVGVYGG